MRFFKENSALVIALALPILLIAGILLAVYLPRAFAEPPSYQFAYAQGEASPCTRSLDVIDGRVEVPPLEQESRPDYCQEYEMPEFYIYDPVEKAHTLVSLEELQEKELDERTTAPDGYRLIENRGHRGIFELFGDASGDQWYIDNGRVRYAITMDHLPAYPNPRFLGWVVE